MKINRFCILLFIVLLPVAFFGCQRSPVSDETKRLEGLAKVWGFMKYYHPEVASGAFNWDSVLVNTIPKVMEAQSKEAYNRTISDLLEVAGDVDSCPNCTVTNGDSLISMVDFSWMDSPLFTTENSDELKFIKNNKQPFDNYYVQPSNLNDARFPEEKTYEDLENPDVHYRLLALFRYWNAIEYFYPYKNLTEMKWDKVLRKMIPVFMEAEGGYEYYLAIAELHTHINDGHAFINSEKYDKKLFGDLQVPLTLNRIDGQIFISSFRNDSIAEVNPLFIGDIITHLNGESIENRYNLLSKYLSSPNSAQHQRVVLQNLLDGSEKQAQVTVLRDNEHLVLEVERFSFQELQNIPDNVNPLWKNIDEEIGYVNMSRVSGKEQVEEVFEHLMDTDVLILDVRNYPPFMPFFEFISHLFEEEYPVLSLFTEPYFDMPGYFIKRGKANELHKEVLVPLKEKTYSGHLILLVNEFTQSRAEFFTAILQNYPQVTTIGSQTAGSDGNITFLTLPGGIRTWFTGLGTFYGDGTLKQRKGVKVDIVVQPTRQGIKEGKDEVLDQAIDWAVANK